MSSATTGKSLSARFANKVTRIYLRRAMIYSNWLISRSLLPTANTSCLSPCLLIRTRAVTFICSQSQTRSRNSSWAVATRAKYASMTSQFLDATPSLSAERTVSTLRIICLNLARSSCWRTLYDWLRTTQWLSKLVAQWSPSLSRT